MRKNDEPYCNGKQPNPSRLTKNQKIDRVQENAINEVTGLPISREGVEDTKAQHHDLADTNENNATPSFPEASLASHSDPTIDTFSDASQVFWGYIDAKKITQRTGIAIENLTKFGLKEALDNSCDAAEDNSTFNSASSPTVTAWITKEDKESLKIVIRNSNYTNKKTFDRFRLEAIFNYNKFHSSKLNQYKVTRGALGDAMKEWATISYALINSNIGTAEDKQWDHPLIIRQNKTEYKIHTHVDRTIQRINTEFGEDVHDESIDNYTEVQFKLPIVPEIEDELTLWDIRLYCAKYVLWSTHISFEFHLTDDKQDFTISIPATQPMSSAFTTTNSIYFYSLRDFENFIYNLHDLKQTVYQTLLNSKFREAGWNYFASNSVSKITIEKLRSSPRLIKDVYDLLRRSMEPIRMLPVPYGSSVPGHNKRSRK